ncbi:MAG: bifunctional phosphopantothenoylcysteine decarboxylase/phosphopantothenate--cysteine ligase CoaBC [Candidatus Pelethousia sp.]|nr:bifunctional phosphopantothenoylcysteine decarboxylase/phosphopantothenate--cysteine ligase CoaBC [Candidatus Pelethousia sp.]
MAGKTVVLGVTGSIAAYKACDIISRFVKQGICLRVILTEAGARFVTPLALETISGAPVISDMFHRETPWEVEHIALAKAADLFLIAPATANFLSKAAHGIADDMLSTTILATRAPILVAPAMNSAMYLNPVVQENMAILAKRGYGFIQPASGRLACGEEGVGKLADVEQIVATAMAALYPKRDFQDKRILISAGPTQEYIDPVRYITNRSSGKMGYAIARAAAARGAQVVLVSGPVTLPAPAGVKVVPVVSSADMFEAVNDSFDACDALVMAAAPADFTPATVSTRKIKKQGSGMELSLANTRDILAAVGARKGNRILMGFAAESENLAANAKGKLIRKNLDFIAANDITATDAGFGVDTNRVTLYGVQGGAEDSGPMSKSALADWLLDKLARKMGL